MMEIVRTAASFALAGIMLGIMLLFCAATLALCVVAYEKGSKAIIKWRADRRYERAKRSREQELKVIRNGRAE